MKFIGEISKIDSEVRVKEDNPLGEEAPEHFSDPKISFISDLNRKAWHEAEANRKEYDVAKNEYFIAFGDLFWKSYVEIPYKIVRVKVGDRIEGDIVDGQIVNVKLC